MRGPGEREATGVATRVATGVAATQVRGLTDPRGGARTRVLNYEGGAHVFSDGSDVFHSDFMSGWPRQDLQRVLDECDNDSEAAVSSSGPARATPEGLTDAAAAAAAQNPDAFCPEWLTFRGTPKVEGEAAEEDFDIVDDLGAWAQVPVPVVPRLTRRPPLQRGCSPSPPSTCRRS